MQSFIFFFFTSETSDRWLFFVSWQAYLFNDYWEDIGTIKSFFDANLALTDQVYSFHLMCLSAVFCLVKWIFTSYHIFYFLQPPKFHFYDPLKPIFTCPQFLPPSKIEKCRVWFYTYGLHTAISRLCCCALSSCNNSYHRSRIP